MNSFWNAPESKSLKFYRFAQGRWYDMVKNAWKLHIFLLYTQLIRRKRPQRADYLKAKWALSHLRRPLVIDMRRTFKSFFQNAMSIHYTSGKTKRSQFRGSLSWFIAHSEDPILKDETGRIKVNEYNIIDEKYETRKNKC